MLIVDVLTNFFGQLIIMNNFAFDTLPLKWLEDTFPVGCWVGGWVFGGWVLGGWVLGWWVAGLSGTKTKLNSS